MFQRIQSLYLGGLVILSILNFFFPLANYVLDSNSLVLRFFGTNMAEFHFPSLYGMAAICSFMVILGMIVLFNYKKRKLQLKLLMIIMVLNLGLVIWIYILTDHIEKMENILSRTNYDAASLFPLITVILIIMSNRAIRKDEAMLKSSDRLR